MILLLLLQIFPACWRMMRRQLSRNTPPERCSSSAMMSGIIILSLQRCKRYRFEHILKYLHDSLGGTSISRLKTFDQEGFSPRGPKRNQRSRTLLLQCPIHDRQNEPVDPCYLTGRVLMVLLKQDGIWVKPSAFEGRIVLKHGNVSILIIQRLFESVRYSRYYVNLFSFTKGN